MGPVSKINVSKIFSKAVRVVATDNRTSPGHHHETKIHGNQKQVTDAKTNDPKALLFIFDNTPHTKTDASIDG
jgi:hypothetical protein